MAQRQCTFVYLKDLEKFPYPAGFPFNISRAKKTRQFLTKAGLINSPSVEVIDAAPADRLTLKKFHSARYLHALKQASDGKFDPEAFYMGIGTGDCPVFPGMYQGAALSCGGTLAGVKILLEGEKNVVFNPAGGLHHARAEMASGFCYINDVALACMEFAQAGKKVLYLDVDVHHGDGVEQAFYSRSDVMTISLHQDGRTLFPGTGFPDQIGTGQGTGYSVNIPLPVGTYDDAYIRAFDSIVPALIEVYEPDCVVFELGTDGLAGDPLANFSLTNNCYESIIATLLSLDKPILMTGGGGYNVENTARAWAFAFSVLCGAQIDELREKPLEISYAQRQTVAAGVDSVIEAVKKNVFGIHGL